MNKDNFNNRKQFKFYRSYYDIAKEITNDKERADYLMAVCEYQFTGIEPELTGMTKFAFLSQKHSLEKQVVGYEFATTKVKNTEAPPMGYVEGYPKGVSVPMPPVHTPVAIKNKEEIIKNKEEIIKNKVNSINERKLKFASTLNPFLDVYGKDFLNEFYKYWTEPNKSNTKFRQELEKTWSLERRLETWLKNQKIFEKEKSSEKKEKEKIVAGRQTIETIQKNLDMTGIINPWLEK